MRKLNLLLALVWSLMIGIACLITINTNVGGKIPFKDKFVHFVFYFLFTILWFRTLDSRFPNEPLVKKLRIVFLFGFCYGVGIEICQGLFTATRSADIFDVLANITGGLIAIVLLYLNRSLKLKD
ncbi:VanZ family protein [Flavobacterium supellecticarium]|uniref:VanZ family protein n=1 Tax=Flavobacterium supellecticarium TaxID=2565924 RepID=A0A4S3ZT43_9FLAO|nr:VanZ family protein [Flavobacterium supellecticarium]THF48856.1 VanZ family protein [Flavobacterium supellecticarium]